jgi:hypothetical protein
VSHTVARSAPERGVLAAIGLGLLALLSFPPLLVSGPAEGLFSSATTLVLWGSRAGVVLLMLASIVVATTRAAERPLGVTVLLLLVAAVSTAGHWYGIDRQPANEAWQRRIYGEIVHQGWEGRAAAVPHSYRPLSYGFTRTLEWLTGDWTFACLTYRWFFLYWFLWFWYRFARLFLPPWPALLCLLPWLVYYPVSILRYAGQLTDPMSHALFALALIYLVRDRWLALLGALVLGVFAKETAVLLVPAYLACYGRQGPSALGRTMILGAGCTLAFLAARWPLGWRPGASLNGVEGWLLWDNLGIGEPSSYSEVPLVERYLHPLGFVLPFLPPILWGWRATDWKLRVLFLTLTPLIVACHVTLSWAYESRNYMPVLPVLATLAAQALTARAASSEVPRSARSAADARSTLR